MKIFLIADDSPVVRKVARRLIEDLGFVVVEASNGDEAYRICRDSMPDAAVIDWDMPGTDSIEIIRQIRSLPEGDAIRILYCTSEVLLSEMTRAKRAGANGFLLKPYNRKLLVQKFIDTEIMGQSPRAA